MRHSKRRYQLNRFTSWHDATIASLARNILIHQSIRTTEHRAKAARPLVEKLIALSKANTLAAKRQAYKVLGDHKLVSVLFNEIGPRFANRQSGYVRIIGLGSRRGDNAEVALFELTEIKKKEPKKAKKDKNAKTAAAESAHGEESVKEKAQHEAKGETQAVVKEKPPVTKKPAKKFLGGLKNIFKKERDSL